MPGVPTPARPPVPGGRPPAPATIPAAVRAAAPGALPPRHAPPPEVSPAPGPSAGWGHGAPPGVPPAVRADVLSGAGGFVQQEQAAAGFDDDDAVSMPAPSSEYLAHTPHHSARTKGPAATRSGLRPTLIPVLFTTALLLLTTAVLKFVVHPDAPLAAMPTWLAVVLVAAALALAGVAVLHVLQGRVARDGATAEAAGSTAANASSGRSA